MIKKPVKKATRIYEDRLAEVQHQGETVEEFLARGGKVKKLPAHVPSEGMEFIPGRGKKNYGKN